MKKVDFCEALGDINENYVQTAHASKARKKPVWMKLGAMAACLAIVAATAFSVLPNYLNQQGVTPPDGSNGIIADNPNDDTPLTTHGIHICMDDIAMNQIDGFTSVDYTRYDPKTDDEVVWSKENIAAYYGIDLTPIYIPNGLLASSQNGYATVYIRQDSTVAEDTVWLGFYHAYNEDGSPEFTKNIAAKQGFSISASKIGIVNDCIYILPENEVKTSNIEGTAVIFGHRSMPYAPYNSETHEPSGYYDMYVAEFEHAGIQYQIIAEQIKMEELVKVVTSVISGAKEIIVDNGPYMENYKDIPELPNAEPNWID